MMRVITVVLASFFAITSLAQKIDPDFQFFVKNDPEQLEVKQAADGNYFIFGRFDYYGSKFTGPLVKVDVTGKLVDGFKRVRGRNHIHHVIELSSGKILALTGDLSSGGRLMRLNADGTTDGTFAIDPNLLVITFSLQSTGKIIAIVHDGNYGYTIRRLNVDGTADNTFPHYSPVAFHTNIAIASDDKIYFDPPTYSGNATVSRLSANGAWDNTFLFTSTNNWIDLINIMPDGKLLVTGGSQNLVPYKVTLEKVNTNGTLDAGFTPPEFSSQINSQVITPAGKIIVGGVFMSVDSQPGSVVELNANGTLSRIVATTYSNGVQDIYVDAAGGIFITGTLISAVNGVAVHGLARIGPNQAVDTNFKNDAFSTGEWENKVAGQSGGKVLVYGSRAFRGVSDNTTGLVRVLASGSPDPAFVHPLNQNASNGSLVIKDVLVQSNDKIIVAAQTAFPGGKSFGRLNANGTLDDTFKAGTGPAGGSAFVEHIRALGSKIYVAGEFDSWNGTPGSMLAILNEDGERIGPQHNVLPASFPSFLADMELQSDGKMLMYGYFPFQSGTKDFIRLNADGSLDNSFNIVLPSGGNISDITVDPLTDQFYISGSGFEGIMGRSLAKYSKDGVRDLTFDGNGFQDFPVMAQVIGGGMIAIAGGNFFEKYKGQSSPGFVIVNQNGQRVSFGTDFNPTTTCIRTFLLNDGLYIVGRFSEGSDETVSSVRRITLPVANKITDIWATAASGVVTLSWTGGFNFASEIVVERSANDQNNFTAIATISNTATTYVDNAAAGSKFYYRIKGKNKFYSETSSVVSVDIVGGIAALPATEITGDSFVANWEHVENTDKVQVQLSKNNFSTIEKEVFVEDAVSHQFDLLEKSETYQYRVRRYEGEVVSAFSNTITVVLRMTNDVSSFNAFTTTPSGISLRWTGTIKGAPSLELWMSPKDELNYTKIATLTPATRQYDVTGLTETTKYFFKLQATKGTDVVSTKTFASTTILPSVALPPTQITSNSFIANWEYLTGTDSVLLQVSNDNFATFLTGLGNKIVKSGSLKIEGLQEAGVYQYRVKRFRGGVSSAFSTAISSTLILGLEDEAELLVFPNPVKDFLNIAIPGATVEIFNMYGASLYSGNSNKIDMSEYATGIYLIKIENKILRLAKIR